MPKLESIKPGKKFDPAKLIKEIEGALDKAAEGATEDFEATQRTWSDKSKAKFRTYSYLGTRIIRTLDTPYVFVDHGTRAHTIKPKSANALAFSANYKAKTSPGQISSQAGGASGATIIRRMEVRHPGTEPRDFSKVIQKKWDKLLERYVRDALKRGLP